MSNPRMHVHTRCIAFPKERVSLVANVESITGESSTIPKEPLFYILSQKKTVNARILKVHRWQVHRCHGSDCVGKWAELQG